MVPKEIWRETTAAAKLLQLSPERLRRMRRSGVLQPKIHFRLIGGRLRKRPRIQWNVTAIVRTFEDVPEHG